MSFDNSYRLKSLRIIAQQKYIIGFSRMNKSQLINILNKRSEECILTVPGDIFNSILEFSTIQDKAVMRKVSKTMRIRVQSNLTDFEKKVLKQPTKYFDDIITKLLKTSDIKQITIMNKFITANYETYNDPSVPGYKTNIVNIIKHFLDVVQKCNTKRGRIKFVIQIMKFVSGRTYFLQNHKKFALTVKNKMIEFESEDGICGNDRIELDYYKTRVDNIVSDFTEEQLQKAERDYKNKERSVCQHCNRIH